MLTQSTNPHYFSNIARKFNALAKYSRLAYYLLTIAVALCGIAFILLFPALILLGISNLDHAFYVAFNMNNWLALAIWLPLIAISTIVSCRIVGIKLPAYSGINVNYRTVPDLVKTVTELQKTYKRPKLDNIVISDQYILDIVKTPLFGLPFGSTNTLVIGLPVLLTMSPLNFRCALERKFGQFSKRIHFLDNWLYQLRFTWLQYNEIYAGRLHSGDQILSWFFRFFTPLYNAVSTHAYNRVNLRTDTFALENISDIDLLDMIKNSILSKSFLHSIYWPSIQEMVHEDSSPSPHPFYRMTDMFHKTLQKCDTRKLLQDALAGKNASINGETTLDERLDNLGYYKLSTPNFTEESAALEYLGQAYHSIIGIMDRYWITNKLPQYKLAYEHSDKQKSAIFSYGNIADNIR